MEQIQAWFVVVMGIGTVFISLICIVLICQLFGLIFSRVNDKKQTNDSEKLTLNQEEKSKLLAAIASAIAFDSGVDPAVVKIKSVKKM